MVGGDASATSSYNIMLYILLWESNCGGKATKSVIGQRIVCCSLSRTYHTNDTRHRRRRTTMVQGNWQRRIELTDARRAAAKLHKANRRQQQQQQQQLRPRSNSTTVDTTIEHSIHRLEEWLVRFGQQWNGGDSEETPMEVGGAEVFSSSSMVTTISVTLDLWLIFGPTFVPVKEVGI